MSIIEFIKIFKSIKPSFDEILKVDPSMSIDVAKELNDNYDLELTSIHGNDEPIIDLILNTNISNLYFSQIQLNSDFIARGKLIKIGYVLEKAYLYLDNENRNVVIYILNGAIINNKSIMTQDRFLLFWLKYLEFDFNKIFRKDTEGKYINKEVSIADMKTNILFKTLLDEIET